MMRFHSFGMEAILAHYWCGALCGIMSDVKGDCLLTHMVVLQVF